MILCRGWLMDLETGDFNFELPWDEINTHPLMPLPSGCSKASQVRHAPDATLILPNISASSRSLKSADISSPVAVMAQTKIGRSVGDGCIELEHATRRCFCERKSNASIAAHRPTCIVLLPTFPNASSIFDVSFSFPLHNEESLPTAPLTAGIQLLPQGL